MAHIADTGAEANVIPLSFLGKKNFEETSDSEEIVSSEVINWITTEHTYDVAKVVWMDLKLTTEDGRELEQPRVKVYVVADPGWKEFIIGKATLRSMHLLSPFLE